MGWSGRLAYDTPFLSLSGTYEITLDYQPGRCDDPHLKRLRRGQPGSRFDQWRHSRAELRDGRRRARPQELHATVQDRMGTLCRRRGQPDPNSRTRTEACLGDAYALNA